MGCDKVGHVHEWPTSGTLVIQRCEQYCNFCNDGKPHKYAWFLRRHVRTMHIEKGPYTKLEVPRGWDNADAKADKRKKTRERRKKAMSSRPPAYVVQPVYIEQLEQGPSHYAVDPAALNVQATTGFGLDEILANETDNYGFALGLDEPSRLMPDDIMNSDNVESWLNHLIEGADDLPPLDAVDASAAYLFNTTMAAEANEPKADLSPLDSVSNVSDDFEAAFDDADIPYLPTYNTDNPPTSPASINDGGPTTPTPIFTRPSFFSDAAYNHHDLNEPTQFYLPSDNTPKLTPLEDTNFQNMMTFLEMASEQMTQQGMGLAQVLSCVNTFSQSLQARIPERKSLSLDAAAAEVKKKRVEVEAVDLTGDDDDDDDDDAYAFHTMPAPTFSQILGEGFEV